MSARPQITVLDDHGQPVGRIEPGGETVVLVEAERERVERIAEHRARPRPPRAEGGCITPARDPRI